MISKKSCLIMLCLLSFPVFAQSVLFNEFMSSNISKVSDEDGQYSDWIELYNPGSTTVNLKGYGLSDDKNKPMKWVFPETFLSPHSFTYVFASGKDRKPVTVNSAVYWETIIDWGDDWKYFRENTEPPANWRDLNFDDSEWRTGSSGFGYGDGDDSTVISKTISLMVRRTFEISDISEITAGMLHVDYDDAFVAYINGVEVARANIGQAGIIPAYNQMAIADKEANIYQGKLPEYFEIKNLLQILHNGENVLAIEVHNRSAANSDLTLIPFFTLGMNKIPSNHRGINNLTAHSFGNLHTNFQISSGGEKIFLTNSSGQGLDTLFSLYVPGDVSYGRKPDGFNNWSYFAEPTPGVTNNNSAEYATYADSIYTSHASGFYNSPVTISLSTNTAGAKIYYTLDGAEPTTKSNLYSAPIIIDSTRVLRARAFEASLLPGPVKTMTFLINEHLNLPVISIVTDPPNLWDEETGIYVLGKNYTPSFPYFGANFWQDWEKPAHLEFFEADGEMVLNQDFGLKIFGTWSRANPQRSLALIARDKYGKAKFKYKIFPNLEFNDYSSFILRNGGNDFGNAMIRDEMMQKIIRDHTDIDNEEYRHIDVFLNGKYWGIYCAREKISEDYLAQHHNVDPDSIDLLEFVANVNDPQVMDGNTNNYTNMINYISVNSVKSDQAYEYIKTQVDIDNFLDYEIAEIYFNNTDWPGNNIKFWRSKNPVTRWRWILFGAEYGFGLYGIPPTNNSLVAATTASGSSWPNPPSSTFLLRKLLENNNFKNEFIRRFADYINITFDPVRVQNIIADMQKVVEPDIARHIDRWNDDDVRYSSVEDWYNSVSVLDYFAQERPANMRDHIIQKFGLSGTADLNFKILPSGCGGIKTNRLSIPNENWKGTYFKNVPVTFTAVPKPGYRFKNWSGASTSNNPVLTLNISSNQDLTANFELAQADTNKIVINEINYNSPKQHDSEDWIELFNNNEVSIDVSGWKLKGSDSSNVFVLPQNSILTPFGYLVVCRDKAKFSGLVSNVKNAVGDLGFGLSANGEKIELCDQNDKLVDKVKYNDKTPWPFEPDGNGPTLELKDPNLDNSLPESWIASSGNYGTPGMLNSSLVDVKEEVKTSIELAYKLEQNYPNPFNPVTKIRFSLPGSEHVKINIYDILGRELLTLVNEYKVSGMYEVELNGSKLPSGIYFYTMKAGNFSNTKKLIITK